MSFNGMRNAYENMKYTDNSSYHVKNPQIKYWKKMYLNADNDYWELS